MEPADSLYPIPRYNGPMNWRARCLIVLLLAMAVAGCATLEPPSSSSSSRAPRVRCLDNPSRDYAEGYSPFIFLFCMQSP
jgi:hypothetical protein